MNHVRIQWHKPVREKPISSGFKWLLSGLWQDVAASRRLIRRHGDAIPHINGAIMLPVAIAAALEGRPWIWHLNDTTVPRFLAHFVKFLVRAGHGKPVAASRSVVEYYDLPDSSDIAYPPASIPEDAPVRGGEVRRIGVMANISPGKGIEDVIEAFAIVWKKRNELKLVIGGRILENKRWYYESLKQQSRDLGIESAVIFDGFVENPVRWMEEIDLFMFSSHFEAAPVALIEALASGLPIVSGEIPPTREILGGCGVLTPLGDAEAMAGEVLRLIGDNAARAELSAKARKRAGEVFSLEAISRKYCEIYSGLKKGKK
ncbi:MAG: glycosyltransferase family 4 protein [Burkholderiales bacterium]|nr:glycosyltransferase family 4 protein [Burkholderiales bacterium]